MEMLAIIMDGNMKSMSFLMDSQSIALTLQLQDFKMILMFTSPVWMEQFTKFLQVLIRAGTTTTKAYQMDSALQMIHFSL